MKRIILSLLLMSVGISGFCTKVTITTPGFVFSPASITISLGDSVQFSIGNIHRVTEVTEGTWNSNNNTPLPGFSTPFGGGLILPAQLTVGTHWYVCVPHAEGGMKGIIIVENTTSIGNQPTAAALNLFPNPSNGIFQWSIDNTGFGVKSNLEIYTVQGSRVYAIRNLEQASLKEIDLTTFGKGIYWVKITDGTAIYTRKVIIQ